MSRDCNILDLNCQLQLAFDAHQEKVMDDMLEKEDKIHTRSLLMNGLIRDLRAKRIDKKEEDLISLDQNILDRINDFRVNHWPELAKNHSGRITDDHNPFPNEVANEVLGREIDDILDRLSTLLDQEQNAISHVTRDLKSQLDLAYHCSTMTAERAKHNPNRTFVANQLRSKL